MAGTETDGGVSRLELDEEASVDEGDMSIGGTDDWTAGEEGDRELVVVEMDAPETSNWLCWQCWTPPAEKDTEDDLEPAPVPVPAPGLV